MRNDYYIIILQEHNNTMFSSWNPKQNRPNFHNILQNAETSQKQYKRNPRLISVDDSSQGKPVGLGTVIFFTVFGFMMGVFSHSRCSYIRPLLTNN